jgi:hypothetical protein
MGGSRHRRSVPNPLAGGHLKELEQGRGKDAHASLQNAGAFCTFPPPDHEHSQSAKQVFMTEQSNGVPEACVKKEAFNAGPFLRTGTRESLIVARSLLHPKAGYIYADYPHELFS